MHQTISVGDQLRSFEPLIISIVNSFIRKEHNDRDDALQEARITALTAISSYTISKKCKLSWYITQCVRNRMVDLKRSENKVPSLRYFNNLDEESELALELGRVTSFNIFNCVEFRLTCERLLTKEEHQLFRQYWEYGYTYQEIIDNLKNDVTMLKSNRKIQGDLKKCLLLIYQKLKSNEQSPVTKT